MSRVRDVLCNVGQVRQKKMRPSPRITVFKMPDTLRSRELLINRIETDIYQVNVNYTTQPARSLVAMSQSQVKRLARTKVAREADDDSDHCTIKVGHKRKISKYILTNRVGRRIPSHSATLYRGNLEDGWLSTTKLLRQMKKIYCESEFRLTSV